jgi:hypothetical protein
MCHFLRSSLLRSSHFTRATTQTDAAPLRPADGLQRWSSYLDRMPDDFIDALSGRDDRPPDANEGARHAPHDVPIASHHPG